jgi:hypothetical protein
MANVEKRISSTYAGGMVASRSGGTAPDKSKLAITQLAGGEGQ